MDSRKTLKTLTIQYNELRRARVAAEGRGADDAVIRSYLVAEERVDLARAGLLSRIAMGLAKPAR